MADAPETPQQNDVDDSNNQQQPIETPPIASQVAEDEHLDDQDGPMNPSDNDQPEDTDAQHVDGQDDDAEAKRRKAREEFKQREARRKESQKEVVKEEVLPAVENATDEELRGLVGEVLVERQFERIQRDRQVMQTDEQRAMKDFPIFDKDSPDYDEDAYKEALEDFAPYVKTKDFRNPESGEIETVILGSKKPLYDHLKKHSERIERYKRSGKLTGQQHAQREQQLAEPESHAGGGSDKKDARKDSELSAAEYAKKYNLKHVRA